jgi:WD40 repeat protein
VNQAVQYRPEDFIDKIRQQSISSGDLNEKLDKFIDRVQYRVEAALQSNEIINVFQDDFEMLGDDEAGASSKSTAVSLVPRTYFEQEYCKQKTVSCIRFHPTKEHLVAIALVEHFKEYEQRVNLMGLSFDSYVLILNFKDPHIITLNYILQTPVEITSIEFHPENPRVMVGGAINGQVIIWDLGSVDHRITQGRKPAVAKMPDEEEDKTQQTAVKLKQLILSQIERSHKNFVADVKFIPKNVRVDKRQGVDGFQHFFMSCSEDGWIHIWDTRPVQVEELSRARRFEWTPFQSVNLYRMDGSGEVGLSRILFKSTQDTTTFFGSSDEGDLLFIDWSIKPVGEENKIAECVKI